MQKQNRLADDELPDRAIKSIEPIIESLIDQFVEDLLAMKIKKGLTISPDELVTLRIGLREKISTALTISVKADDTTIQDMGVIFMDPKQSTLGDI